MEEWNPAWVVRTSDAIAMASGPLQTLVHFGCNVAYSLARDVVFHGRPLAHLGAVAQNPQCLDAWLFAVCGENESAKCYSEHAISQNWEKESATGAIMTLGNAPTNYAARLPLFVIHAEMCEMTRALRFWKDAPLFPDEVRAGRVLAALDVGVAKNATAVLRAFRTGWGGREDIARGIARFVVAMPDTVSKERAQAAFDIGSGRSFRWTTLTFDRGPVPPIPYEGLPQLVKRGPKTWVPPRMRPFIAPAYHELAAWIHAREMEMEARDMDRIRARVW